MDEFLKMLVPVALVVFLSLVWDRLQDVRLAVGALTKQQKQFEATLSEISAKSELDVEDFKIALDRLETRLVENRE